MRKPLTFDSSYTLKFIREVELDDMSRRITEAHDMLHQQKTNCGWLECPLHFSNEEKIYIEHVAENIRHTSEILLIIGTGGSYNGSRAAIEMLCPTFSKDVDIIFVGQHLSSTYLAEVMAVLQDKQWSINVISKSGSTFEPLLTFRLFRQLLAERYGIEGARRRIYVTTDKQHGILRQMANEEGYTSFVVPRDIGGRYSVLTAVGLLPMAVSGIDIDQVIAGAKHAFADFSSANLYENKAYEYAAIRNLLYREGKTVELLSLYEPSLQGFANWWKQLFAESEGKDGKGIFPVSATFPADLHSFGQYIQDGMRNLFQTLLYVKNSQEEIVIENDCGNPDGLNYLTGMTLDYINEQAFMAALKAHTDSGVPNIVITLEESSAYAFGYMTYFFQKACAISALLLGVNPFDQPGVEAYKQNMFRLLGGHPNGLEKSIQSLAPTRSIEDRVVKNTR